MNQDIKRRQIECLNRLQAVNGGFEDIVQFLKQEDLIAPAEITALRGAADKAKDIHLLLSNLSACGKLQLLTYEWNLLPIESIKILILTNRDQKEFTYNF